MSIDRHDPQNYAAEAGSNSGVLAPGGKSSPVASSAYAPVRYDLAGNPIVDDGPGARSPGAASPDPPAANAPSPPVFQQQTPAFSAAPPAYQSPPPAGYAYGGVSLSPPRKCGAFVAAAIGGAVLVIALVGAIVSRVVPRAAATPTGYAKFECPDKTFTCMGPQNWEEEGSGAPGMDVGEVTFKSGDASIAITSDFSGSLMGDILLPPANQTADDSPGDANAAAPPPPTPPIEKLHAMYQSKVSAQFPDYHEAAMVPAPLPGVGDGRLSEFTAGAAQDHIHGMRMTVLGRERAFTIVCSCAESEWPRLKDSFWKVASSLTAEAS